MAWKCKNFLFDAGPYIMGVLNVTPDSFSDGGKYLEFDKAMAHAHELLAQGADIIDVGGESTRPGSFAVSEEEEIMRVLPVVTALVDEGVCVSVDTRHASVAEACLDVGAHIINDISGFRNRRMREAVANSNCGVIVMHMKGSEPKTMQDDPEYEDVVSEVCSFLFDQGMALEAMGIDPERICIDPGPGFGKTVEQSRKVIEATSQLAQCGYSIMVACSRKSIIGTLTGIEIPVDRDEASALCAAALCHEGALVARVHNVEAMVNALAGSHRALVALGSNIGDGKKQLDEAIAALRRTPGIWVTHISRYVESEPAYVTDQAVFTNAVALIQTNLTPFGLLEVLHRIENEQGRVRTQKNGPRTLDLDILDYEGVVSDDPVCTLPHPRVLERDFVVKPLLQVCPDYVLADGTPVTTDSVQYGKVLRTL